MARIYILTIFYRYICSVEVVVVIFKCFGPCPMTCANLVSVVVYEVKVHCNSSHAKIHIFMPAAIKVRNAK